MTPSSANSPPNRRHELARPGRGKGLALGAYRLLQGALARPAGAFFPRAGAIREGRRVLEAPIPERVPGKPRFWFHGASAGELETLWSVASALSAGGAEIAVTVFSESGRRPLERLASELSAAAAPPVFSGFSPWEGSWGAALDRVAPDVFVTARYEAWPELWASLAQRDIPLLVAAALDRRSLRIGARAARFLAGKLPALDLCAIEAADADELRAAFPDAAVHVCGDPRWDRVFERASRGHPRARALGEAAAMLPGPFGILAQVWPADLEAWGESLRALPGSFWVVPHSLEEGVLAAIEERLARLGFEPGRTSRGAAAGGALIVDEMGFLLELYARADWAYVGGGFGDGVHSTLEPAVYGIPLVCGPRGVSKFPEIGELSRSGQLTVAREPAEIAAWVRGVATGAGSAGERFAWKRQAELRRGAAAKVADVIRSRIERRGDAP